MERDDGHYHSPESSHEPHIMVMFVSQWDVSSALGHQYHYSSITTPPPEYYLHGTTTTHPFQPCCRVRKAAKALHGMLMSKFIYTKYR